jgi:hypothetical protein
MPKPGRDPLTLPQLQRRFSDAGKCLALAGNLSLASTADDRALEHRISGKHMGRYLREVAFRLNHRGDGLVTMFNGTAGPLPLAALLA